MDVGKPVVCIYQHNRNPVNSTTNFFQKKTIQETENIKFKKMEKQSRSYRFSHQCKLRSIAMNANKTIERILNVKALFNFT